MNNIHYLKIEEFIFDSKNIKELSFEKLLEILNKESLRIIFRMQLKEFIEHFESIKFINNTMYNDLSYENILISYSIFDSNTKYSHIYLDKVENNRFSLNFNIFGYLETKKYKENNYNGLIEKYCRYSYFHLNREFEEIQSIVYFYEDLVDSNFKYKLQSIIQYPIKENNVNIFEIIYIKKDNNKKVLLTPFLESINKLDSIIGKNSEFRFSLFDINSILSEDEIKLFEIFDF